MTDKPNNLSVAMQREYLGLITKHSIGMLRRSRRCIGDIFAKLFMLI